MPSSIATDSEGNVYVSGRTNSSDFPVTKQAYDSLYNGGNDIFVTKINATGTQLVYSTFLAGSDDGIQWGFGDIVVDKKGQAIVAEYVGKNGFRVTPNAYRTGFSGGSCDIYLVKLNTTGTSLVFGTYLGGSKGDRVSDIKLDSEGNIYLLGNTQSTDFPFTSGAYDISYNGGSQELYGGDAFLAKLDSSGEKLLYSTFIGGNNDELAGSITLLPTGNLCFSIGTKSGNLKTSEPAFSTYHSGGNDLYFGRFNDSLNKLEYAAYIGGNGNDYPGGMEINDSGIIYISGGTTSVDLLAVEAFQPNNKGNNDGFIMKIILEDELSQNINKNETLNGVEIFPNPTTGEFTISFGTTPLQAVIVEIYNTEGRLILTKTFRNTTTATIDLTSNPHGMYLATLRVDGVFYSQKICIE